MVGQVVGEGCVEGVKGGGVQVCFEQCLGLLVIVVQCCVYYLLDWVVVVVFMCIGVQQWGCVDGDIDVVQGDVGWVVCQLVVVVVIVYVVDQFFFLQCCQQMLDYYGVGWQVGGELFGGMWVVLIDQVGYYVQGVGELVVGFYVIMIVIYLWVVQWCCFIYYFDRDVIKNLYF